MSASAPIGVPATHHKHNGASGRAWIAALPALAAEFLDRWALRRDGTAAHGAVALVLPAFRADGTPAALKLQPVDEESAGEPLGLRTWNGDGVVRLLDHDPDTGTMLLERLDAADCGKAAREPRTPPGTGSGSGLRHRSQPPTGSR